MNKQEAINALIGALEKVNFKTGVLGPDMKDTGEKTSRQFIAAMKGIIFNDTGGAIYKFKEPVEFYKDFVQATNKPELTPTQCAVIFIQTVRAAQNSALKAAKARIPQQFWGNIDDLFDYEGPKTVDKKG